jgi:hypothetical protein
MGVAAAVAVAAACGVAYARTLGVGVVENTLAEMIGVRGGVLAAVLFVYLAVASG